MKPIPPDLQQRTPPDLKTLSTEDRSGEYKAFLRYVADSSGVMSYEQATIVWPALCQAAMEWLISERKSVDMGFVILHPSPMRGNWKQAMVTMFPRLGSCLLGKSKFYKQHIMEESGFNIKMQHGEMLAVMGQKYVVWGIETELKKSWWKAMIRNEAHIYRQLGSIKYARYIAKKIVELRPKLVRVYFSFLRQISYPVARVFKSRKFVGGFIIPFVPKGKVRPVADSNLPVSLVVHRDPAKIEASPLCDVVKTNAEMYEMSDIQPDNSDLRPLVGDNIPEPPRGD